MTASRSAPKHPFNGPAVFMFVLTTALMLTAFPWYAWQHGFSGAEWAWFFIFLYASGMSITAGYHRLWAHRAYEAHWLLKLGYMLFGAMALQNSILIWASLHRTHHKHVDDEDQDPYSARRGLWYSHIGWMLRNYPSGQPDFSNARDLQNDRIVMFQQRHYLALALGMNIGLPLLIGFLHGDALGMLMLAGLFRLVVNHHFTFFINSLAHYWGRQPYTTENTARDNGFLALLTYGEGYHNYHHLFQWDYRNGIRWWQWDPTKWWIAACSRLRLTRNLKRVPEFAIQKAKVERQFQSVRDRLQSCADDNRLSALQALLEKEWEHYSATLSAWSRLQQQKFEATRQQLLHQWETSEVRRQLHELEDALRLQYQRIRLLQLQTA